MNDVQQRAAAKHFAEYWNGKGYEKGESQKFWISLLGDVFGIEHASEYISFEDQVRLDHTSFIDGYIPETHVLIEQKGIGKNLKKPIKQSDGMLLKPIQQAQRYAAALPYSQRPRWIVICNFECFHVYDMEHPQTDPIEIWLKDLPTQYYLLEFLVRKEDITLQQEMEISIQAGEIVGMLYDAFLKQYKDPTNEHSLKSLNALCVRLVFCLYAEDAGIFGKRLMFHDYMQRKGLSNARQALIDLFKVLDTPVQDRDPYMDDELAAFPYVNGGLFSDENIEIPRLNQTIYDLLLNKASAAFDWSEISPTIFGAVFESTLNPETRRKGGMHYTSIENIHKVIDPLFLSNLKKELENIKQSPIAGGSRTKKLQAFQAKISSLKFLDPACGSGNFLTESYLCLRKMENEVILLLQGDEHQMGLAILDNPIKVSIAQFYGIEINDFAATVAKTALWIAESQMMAQTEDIVHMSLDFLPLKSYVNIVCDNALRINWNDVIPAYELSYILGNPPFVGKKYQTSNQKNDMKTIFGIATKGVGNLDYVTAWYRKSIEYMQRTNIVAAYVSTNSIVQGEQIPLFWKTLYEQFPITIVFARQTFKWDSEATEKAGVSCVIIGFNAGMPVKSKYLYINDTVVHKVNNIHPYLIDMPDIFIENRSKPLSAHKPLVYGSFALDDGNYTISEDEYIDLVTREPSIAKFLKLFIGSEEFINGKKRYCIWLKGADTREVKKSHILNERVKKVQEWRSQSKRRETIAAADTPMLFAEIRQPCTDYMAIPITSSERRRYIPIGYMTKDVIASNHLLVLPDASLYEFGVLMSNVHMSWMRLVAGRLEMRYNYSARIVYNNFPWCDPTDAQRIKIEKTAQDILSARALYPDHTLADLYDPTYMPNDLLAAHQQNDRAVMEAYGMPIKETTESSCVAELMRRYQAMTVTEDKEK